MTILGTPIVVVNTVQAAKELFERRGAIYSDRRVKLSSDFQCTDRQHRPQLEMGSL